MHRNLIKGIGDRLGEFMLGFSSWLNAEISSCKPDQILFASREGWFMGYCWEVFNRGKVDVDFHYIHTSRRILRLILTSNIEDMEQLLSVPSMDCRLDFFIWERFGVDINEDKYTEILHKLGFNFPGVVINRNHFYKNLRALIPFIADDHFHYILELKRKAIQYYRTFNMEGKKSFLVDIGYNGTFNKGLSSLFSSAKILGRYIATFKGVKDSFKDKGWLYNKLDNQMKNNALSRNVPMLEYLMILQSGSLFDFVLEGDVVAPRVKAINELNGFELVNLIQLYAYNYIVNHKSENFQYDEKKIKEKSKKLLSFLDNPSLAEVNLFRNHFLEDGFGGNSKRFLFSDIERCRRKVPLEADLIFRAAWSGAMKTIIQQQWSLIDKISHPFLLNYWLFRKNLRRKWRYKVKKVMDKCRG